MFYHWRIIRLLPQVMKPEEDYDGLFGEGSLGKLQERHYKFGWVSLV